MNRRTYLVATGAGLLGGLSGCAFRAPVARGRSGEATPGSTDSDPKPLARMGHPPDICSRTPPEYAGIHSIIEPATADDWDDHSIPREYRFEGHDGLAPDQTVVGLATSETARAYPLTVLWDHEVVNDVVGGAPVLVTYCPLCRSGMVAERVLPPVGGHPEGEGGSEQGERTAERSPRGDRTRFWASGLLWIAPAAREAAAADEGRVFGAGRRGNTEDELRHNRNLVLLDEATGSFWSQILARAICGPMKGASLRLVPSTVTTWRSWQERYPETDVLLPPPISTTNRGRPLSDPSESP